MINIRTFNNTDLEKVLALIKRSDSTNRTPDTWKGNNMTAVLAFDSDKLIGLIPLEPRLFSLGAGKFIKILWVSAAHVEPEYRNKGIGAALDEKIKDYFSSEYKGVFVYRQDETSPAYRWYKRIGFQKILPIISLKKDVESSKEAAKYIVLKNESELQKWESRLCEFFKEYNDGYAGFPARYNRFWSDKFKTHYYRDYYSYSTLLLLRQGNLAAYAFIGRTDMKDGVDRLDILETSVCEDANIKDNLYFSIADFAHKQLVKEIRVQISSQDSDLQWWESQGFIERWRTNILGKFFEPADNLEKTISNFPLNKWRYFQIDYI